ncbi:ArsA family ATPase [Nesterenkonia sp. F]|uniref:ArsA family ATPase n=1 Tax=Nesterenkonia sp. F TaxID=795955 RepID=UPI000255D248|nr:ArsA family ATPase [Nesterenkonia sp. F]
MLLDLARSRRVLFIGGKGGVGKTSVASALALRRAREGARVLLISTDPAHNLGHLWERRLGDSATTVWADEESAEQSADDAAPGAAGAGRLDAVEIDPDATASAHLDEVGSTLRSMMPEHLHSEVDKHLDLAARSPGTHESAMLERLAVLLDEGPAGHDLIIVDTAPSGHTVRLMALPEIMTAWTEGLLDRRTRAERFGAAVRALDGDDDPESTSSEGRDRRIRRAITRRRDRFATMRAMITDAGRCSFVIVLTAERLPVLESAALRDQLAEAGVAVGGFVVNRLSPSDAGEFLAGRRAQEQTQLAELRRRADGAAVETLPLLAGELVGVAALDALGAAMDPAETP